MTAVTRLLRVALLVPLLAGMLAVTGVRAADTDDKGQTPPPAPENQTMPKNDMDNQNRSGTIIVPNNGFGSLNSLFVIPNRGFNNWGLNGLIVPNNGFGLNGLIVPNPGLGTGGLIIPTPGFNNFGFNNNLHGLIVVPNNTFGWGGLFPNTWHWHL